MNINSIDNAYEDAGLAQLTTFLAMLNLDQLPTSRLVAILPEYRNGRLDRLNCVTVPVDVCTEDVNATALALDEAGRAVAAQRKAEHDAAALRTREPELAAAEHTSLTKEN